MNFILLVTTHVYLALAAAIFFYWINLNLLSRGGISKKKLLWKSVIVAVSSVVLWLSEVFYLSGYYIGKEGFNTAPGVTELLPLFALVRGILLPFIVAVAVILLVLVLYLGDHVEGNRKLKGILITLSVIGWVGASALMFLGVLLP